MIRKPFRKIETAPTVARLADALHGALLDSGRVSGMKCVDAVGESLA